MASYVILSQFSGNAFSEPREITRLATAVKERIREECPDVVWKDSYALTGRFDVVDLVESDDPAQVERAALIIQAHGHAITETSRATPWKEFLDSL